MNREDLIDRLAVIKMKRYKAFQNSQNWNKYDTEICDLTDLLKQLNSDNLNTLESDTTEILETLESDTTEILETLESDTTEILETLESDTTEILETLDQGSLDKFEVVYQVLGYADEICYESQTVHAYNHEHACTIVSLDLQTQHLRFCITGCEYALLIDDLSDFSLEGHGEF